MAGQIAEAAIDGIVDELDESLRSVIRFDPERYDVLHVRDDVAGLYSESEIDEIHRQQVFEVMHKDYRETLAEGAGALQSTIHLFERIAVVRFLDGDSGVLVSVDRDADLGVDRLVERCTDILESA